MLKKNPSLGVVAFLGICCLLALFYWGFSEALFHFCGIDILQMIRGRKENVSQQGLSDDEWRVRELEWIRDELVEKEKIESLILERREKYLKFLKPYTKVLQGSDFYFGIDQPREEKDKIDSSSTLSSETSNVFENLNVCYETGEMDAELGCCNNVSDCERVALGEACWIKMDVMGEPRYVEGNCSICLLQFEDGDVFVRSTRKACSHGFHQDCALVWLASGKKRCPLCRNFFVPGSSVDDKDIIAHREGDTEAYIPHTFLMHTTQEGREDSIATFSNTGTIEDENNAKDVVYDDHISTCSKRHSESRINAASSTTNASDRVHVALPVCIDNSNVQVIDEVLKHSDASDRVIKKVSRNSSWLNRERSGCGKANFQIHPLLM